MVISKRFIRRAVAAMLVMAMVIPSVLIRPIFAETNLAETNLAETKQKVEYVNTLIGPNTSSTIAGPTMPNGSIHPSPETRSPKNGGYTSGQSVVGFAQLYSQGTGGTQSFGNFLISPQTGTLQTSEANHASAVTDEKGTANYYSATLSKYNIKAEVAPTDNAALYRFTYPESSDSSILLDVSRKIGDAVALRTGSVTIDAANKMITGGGLFRNNWNPSEWNMYFALQYDKTPTEIGVWDGTGLKPGTLSQSTSVNPNTSRLGAYMKFATTEGETVNVKIAISFVSVEKAKEFLNSQIPGWDYEGVKNAAGLAWNEVLDTVDLSDGASEAQKEKFYTALFHTNVQPRNRVSDHGEWDDYYTIWDSWKTVFPFQTLTRPEMVADNLNSFISRYNKSGYISDAFIQGKEFVCGQGGNDIENIIADAYLKNIPGVDWEAAYAAAKGNADNMRTPRYVESGYQYGTAAADKVALNGLRYSSRLYPSSATMGFAYNDYALAAMAKGLGKTADYNKYFARSSNWKNIWDPNMSGDGYVGFAHNKNAGGTFENASDNPTTGYNRDYYECSIWAGSYFPTFDVDSMVALMGGRYTFANRLDFALSKGSSYIDFGNEPAFQTIWLFATPQVKRPDLASKWVAQFLSKFPQGGYPGDEDNGAMSSIYMFMMSGFFPFSCSNSYYLHGGRLPEVTYNLANGKKFTIRNNNASAANIYVQSAKLNGQPLNESWITYEQIMSGATLEFEMGAKPSRWGREAVDPEKRPSDITNFNAEVAAKSVTLTWTAATDEEGIAGYHIYRGFDEDFVPSDDTFVGISGSTTYTEFPGYGVYYYKVLAENNSGNLSRNSPCAHAALDFTGTITSRYTGSLMLGATGKVNAMAAPTEDAQYAFDFNEGTKWSCRILTADTTETDIYPLGSMWLEVDLGTECDVTGWLVLNESPSELREFYLQKKDTPSGGYYDLRHITGNTNIGNNDPFIESLVEKLQAPVTGRYFRLLIPLASDNQTTDNARIKEFHLFGTRNSGAKKYSIKLNPVVGGSADVTVSRTEAEYKEEVIVDFNNLPEGYIVKSLGLAHENGTVSATKITSGVPAGTTRYSFIMPPRRITITPEIGEDFGAPSKVVSIKAEYAPLAVGRVKLSWDESQSDDVIEKYLIYRGVEGDFDISNESLVGESTSTAFTDTPLHDATYFYKITAVSKEGKESDPSDCFYVTVRYIKNASYGATTTTNIALNKDATANGYSAPAGTSNWEYPKNAVDGSSTTKWSCRRTGTPNQGSNTDEFGNFWLQLDLGATYLINRWVVKHAQAGGEAAGLNTRNFSLQAKVGEVWVDIDPVVGNTASITDRSVPNFSARYVRIYVKAPEQGSAGNPRIYEFELYSPAKPAAQYMGSLTALKTGKVHDQAAAAEGAAAALDMNSATKWSARVVVQSGSGYPDKSELAKYPQYPLGIMWLEVDLGSIQRVGKYSIYNESGSVLRDFYIQVKNANGGWDDVVHDTTTHSGTGEFGGTVAKPAVGRYFRLMIPVLGTNQTTDNARIREFHLFAPDTEISRPITILTTGGTATVVQSKTSAVMDDVVTIDVSNVESGKCVLSVKAVQHGVAVPVTEITEGVPAGVRRFSFTMPPCPTTVTLRIVPELFFETNLRVEDKTPISLADAEGKDLIASIFALNATKAPVTATFIAALYDASGKLIATSAKSDVVIAIGDPQTYQVTIPVTEQAQSYKLFIWDDSFVPLADALALNK